MLSLEVVGLAKPSAIFSEMSRFCSLCHKKTNKGQYGRERFDDPGS